MKSLKTKNKQKNFSNIAKHVIARQTKYFRRNVHINHKETYLKILRIKTAEQFHNEIEGFKLLPNNVCFFLYHLNSSFFTKNIIDINDSEFILTNSKTNRVVSLNQPLKNYPDFVNLWIVKKNTIDFLKIKLDDILFTR